ncbi:MAG TPA: hypothetical protein VGF96_08945 [Terracidiphilus sp.]|jgi:hypothetical protein
MAHSIPQDSPAFRLIPASKTLIAKAAELNAVTKSLAKTIEDIEEGLQRLNLGVSAWVPLSSSENGDSTQSLGYAKLQGRWGLVVRNYQYDGGGDVVGYDDSFLLASPRETRVWAAGELQNLFLALANAADSLTIKIKTNLSSADVLAEVLSSVPDPKAVKK